MEKDLKIESEKELEKAEVKNLLCIICPRGCRLTARETPEGLAVTGNFCPRGAEYARQELTDPVRVLTALMRVDGAARPISVKTDRPVPKDLLLACARQIYETHPQLPVRRGDVVLRDVCGTGCSVIATRDAISKGG